MITFNREEDDTDDDTMRQQHEPNLTTKEIDKFIIRKYSHTSTPAQKTPTHLLSLSPLLAWHRMWLLLFSAVTAKDNPSNVSVSSPTLVT